MSFDIFFKNILNSEEIKNIKNLNFKKQREIFNNFSINKIKHLSQYDIKNEDIKLENGTLLRHYKPKKKSNKTVLFIHGGGWCLHSIDTYDHVCRYLCNKGDLNIFSLEYGLAPEYKYPIAINHSLYAYDWLCKNISKFDISSEDIFVMGDSSGGNLVTIICNERQKNIPKAQILIYPVVDMYTSYTSNKKFNKDKYHLTTEWCEVFLKNYVNKNIMLDPVKLKQPKISPIFSENTIQPDTLIIAATHDILIDSIYAYEKKLKTQNTYVESYYDNKMFHGFINLIGITSLNNPRIALTKIISFIKSR